MRTINSAAAAAINGNIALALLIELSLSQPVRVATCRDDITWNGNTFLGGKQGQVDPIKDQGGEVTGLSFAMSGIPSDMIAIALAEPVQGKIVKVWTCIMAEDSQAVLDVLPLWAGTIDQMPISQGAETSTIALTAEHRGLTFARPRGLRYIDADQQSVYPGDRCLEYIITSSQHQDVWPAAAFFKG